MEPNKRRAGTHSATHRRPPAKFKRPPLRIQPTTLWDYPSQDYGEGQQGRPGYKGATPSYIIWNLIQRYTKEKDLVVDPFAGSGTTLDVARDTGRRALGYDVHPYRKDIFRVDARKLPAEDGLALNAADLAKPDATIKVAVPVLPPGRAG